MAILNLDKLKQKKAECSAALVAAMKEQDEGKLEQALESYSQFLGETLGMEAEMAGNHAIDTVVLASRGVRQLTQAETDFYTKFIEAAKASDVKQAINNLDAAVPPTVIDAVLEDVRKAHPLLDRIDFHNSSLFTKYLYSKTGKPTVVWGQVASAITNELEADIGVIDVTQKKLSAFMYVPQDMLDLGPAWVDRFVRELLAEYLSIGLEIAIVDGDGKDAYIGMTRDVSDSVSVVGGVYPKKEAVKLSEITPVSIGNILAIVATNIDKTARPVINPIFVVNPFDYLRKIMPATTIRGADGTYRNDVLPYPMQIIQSAAIKEGEAIIGLPERYFAGIGMGKNGKIEYSDEYKFLEDNRTYKAKFTGNGRPLDNNAFVLCDISELEPAVLKVSVVDGLKTTALNASAVDGVKVADNIEDPESTNEVGE